MNNLIDILLAVHREMFANGSWQERFDKFLEEVHIIRDFDEHRWTPEFIRILRSLANNAHPENREIIVQKIQKHKKEEFGTEEEIIDYLDLIFSFYDLKPDKKLEKAEKYRKKHPFNPEFYAFESYCYENSDSAIFLKKAMEAHQLFSGDMYTNLVIYALEQYLNQVIKQKPDYKSGLMHLKKLLSNNQYDNNHEFRSIIRTHIYRLEDRIDTQEEIKREQIKLKDFISSETENSKKELAKKVRKETKKSKEKLEDKVNTDQRRIIEIIGIFTAVIAFIFSVVSIGMDFNFSQGITFIGLLALSLIGFAILMNILFSKSEVQKPDYWKTALLIIILAIIGIAVFFSYQASNRNGTQQIKKEITIKTTQKANNK